MILDILDAIKTFFTETIPDFFWETIARIRKIDLGKIHFTRKELVIFLSALLVFLFLLSGLFYLVERGGLHRVVLFYPDMFSGKLMGEERFVRNGRDREQDLRWLFEEILLGPSLPGSSPVFSKEVELISLVLIKDHAYINFSSKILFPDRQLPLDITGGLRTCINTIKYNYPWVKHADFYINGEELLVKLPENTKKGNEGIQFDASLLE